jgi:LysR family glycine cleavage system transcriptional activator
VQQALTLLEIACRDVRTATKKQQRYQLNLSANQSVAMLWLAPRLGRFVEAHPDIALQVHLHVNQSPAWKAQDIDVALLHVRDDGPHLPRLGDVPLMAEAVVPVCSPALVAPRLRGDPHTLSRFRWLEEKHVASPETSWQRWQKRLGLQGPPEVGTLALSGMGTVVSAAVAGLGIALGRVPLVDEDIARRRLVPLVPALCMPSSWRYVARIRSGRTHDAVLSALIAFLLEEGTQPASYRCHAGK